MSEPRRRSSRLRGGASTPKKAGGLGLNRLSSLVEHDESPRRGPQSNLDTILSSPLAAPKTPATGGLRAPREEMHPSLIHQTTKKPMAVGELLGFTDFPTAGQHSEAGSAPINTPSKANVAPSGPFDFRFACPAPALGPEAQRMMDELREEALRIKVRLAAEREEEKKRQVEEAAEGGRKIAQAKGKVGRFSDVHMAEFKKMDSIAGHPSAFRAQADRPLPEPPVRSLKRTQSKAKLDNRDVISRPTSSSGHAMAPRPTSSSSSRGGSKIQPPRPLPETPKHTLKRKQSKAKLDDHEDTIVVKQSQSTVRTQREIATPAKRVRRELPKIPDEHAKHLATKTSQQSLPPTTPAMPRSQSHFLESITTPTQASLARSASVKQSNIPMLSRSHSKPNLSMTTGRMAKFSTTANIASLGRSLFNRPGKSSISSSMKTPGKVDLNKELPSVPGSLVRTKSVKNVNFTPDTKETAAVNQGTPSPVKHAASRSKSSMNLDGRQTDAVQYPELSVLERSNTVEYPSLHLRPLPDAPRMVDTPRPPPAVPGTFTFRTDQTIKFGNSPRGFGFSPGQASLRHVRPSILPPSLKMQGSLPNNAKENVRSSHDTLLGIPHGLSNKKRHRSYSDDETEDEEVERSPKKLKGSHLPAEGSTLQPSRLMVKLQEEKMKLEKEKPMSRIPSPSKVKRGVLSLSRLNMLSRPKQR